MVPRFKAATARAAPVFHDRPATTKTAISLIREAAGIGTVAFLQNLRSGHSGVVRLVPDFETGSPGFVPNRSPPAEMAVM